jgi:hypothetical protein
MMMNSTFASTVAVIVPVILLAVGVEARNYEERSHKLREDVYRKAEAIRLEVYEGLSDFDESMSDLEAAQYAVLVEEEVTRATEAAGIPPGLVARGSSPMKWWIGSARKRIGFFFMAGALSVSIFNLTFIEVSVLIWLGQAHPSPSGAGMGSMIAQIGFSTLVLFVGPALRLYLSPLAGLVSRFRHVSRELQKEERRVLAREPRIGRQPVGEISRPSKNE